MNRPLLKTEKDGEGVFVLVPGLISEAIKHLFGLYYDGALPANQIQSDQMLAWKDEEVGNARAKQFEQDMAELVKKHSSLEFLTSITIPRLIQSSLERNFGDIDILTWSAQTGVVYVIECKDFFERKTPGEMGELLSNFRGGYDKKDKPDLLRKHLDRVELMRNHHVKVAGSLGLDKITKIEPILLFRKPVPMMYFDVYKSEGLVLDTVGFVDFLKSVEQEITCLLYTSDAADE